MNPLNERILVTGGTGFVGSHLVRRLHEQGLQVKCLVRPSSEVSKLMALGIEAQRGDILDIKTLQEAAVNIDVIFHLVGGGNVSTLTGAGLTELRNLNVLSLQNILEAARDKPITKFVHFSSINAMGLQKEVKLTENDICKPRSPHEVVKRETEELAAKYFENYGIPITILRPSLIYGPGDTRSEILKIARLVKRHMIPLIDGGRYYMPLVYVDDVINCSMQIMRLGKPGEIYIVSDKLSYTLRDIVEEMARNIPTTKAGIYIPKKVVSLAIDMVEPLSRAVGFEPFFTAHRVESATSNRYVSIDKAVRELGYEPKTNLETGMKRTIEWYKHEGFL